MFAFAVLKFCFLSFGVALVGAIKGDDQYLFQLGNPLDQPSPCQHTSSHSPGGCTIKRPRKEAETKAGRDTEERGRRTQSVEEGERRTRSADRVCTYAERMQDSHVHGNIELQPFFFDLYLGIFNRASLRLL